MRTDGTHTEHAHNSLLSIFDYWLYSPIHHNTVKWPEMLFIRHCGLALKCCCRQVINLESSCVQCTESHFLGCAFMHVVMVFLEVAYTSLPGGAGVGGTSGETVS